MAAAVPLRRLVHPSASGSSSGTSACRNGSGGFAAAPGVDQAGPGWRRVSKIPHFFCAPAAGAAPAAVALTGVGGRARAPAGPSTVLEADLRSSRADVTGAAARLTAAASPSEDVWCRSAASAHAAVKRNRTLRRGSARGEQSIFLLSRNEWQRACLLGLAALRVQAEHHQQQAHLQLRALQQPPGLQRQQQLPWQLRQEISSLWRQQRACTTAAHKSTTGHFQSHHAYAGLSPRCPFGWLTRDKVSAAEATSCSGASEKKNKLRRVEREQRMHHERDDDLISAAAHSRFSLFCGSSSSSTSTSLHRSFGSIPGAALHRRLTYPLCGPRMPGFPAASQSPASSSVAASAAAPLSAAADPVTPAASSVAAWGAPPPAAAVSFFSSSHSRVRLAILPIHASINVSLDARPIGNPVLPACRRSSFPLPQQQRPVLLLQRRSLSAVGNSTWRQQRPQKKRWRGQLRRSSSAWAATHAAQQYLSGVQGLPAAVVLLRRLPLSPQTACYCWDGLQQRPALQGEAFAAHASRAGIHHSAAGADGAQLETTVCARVERGPSSSAAADTGVIAAAEAEAAAAEGEGGAAAEGQHVPATDVSALTQWQRRTRQGLLGPTPEARNEQWSRAAASLHSRVSINSSSSGDTSSSCNTGGPTCNKLSGSDCGPVVRSSSSSNSSSSTSNSSSSASNRSSSVDTSNGCSASESSSSNTKLNRSTSARVAAYWALSKGRLSVWVALSALVGYCGGVHALAGEEQQHFSPFNGSVTEAAAAAVAVGVAAASSWSAAAVPGFVWAAAGAAGDSLAPAVATASTLFSSCWLSLSPAAATVVPATGLAQAAAAAAAAASAPPLWFGLLPLLLTRPTAAGVLTRGAAAAILFAGVFATAAAANALNQLYERNLDSLMKRTRHRPVARGIISAAACMRFAAGSAAAGVWLLLLHFPPTAAVLAASNILLYACVYTPLKTRSPFSTHIGSVVGALPLLIGWTAAGGSAWNSHALLLGGLQYLWQFPHFYILCWLHRHDYKKAGYAMFGVNDDVRALLTKRLCGRYLAALLAAPAVSSACGITSWMYMISSLPANIFILRSFLRFYREPSRSHGRHFFLHSLWHIMLLMLLAVYHMKPVQPLPPPPAAAAAEAGSGKGKLAAARASGDAAAAAAELNSADQDLAAGTAGEVRSNCCSIGSTSSRSNGEQPQQVPLPAHAERLGLCEAAPANEEKALLACGEDAAAASSSSCGVQHLVDTPWRNSREQQRGGGVQQQQGGQAREEEQLYCQEAKAPQQHVTTQQPPQHGQDVAQQETLLQLAWLAEEQLLEPQATTVLGEGQQLQQLTCDEQRQQHQRLPRSRQQRLQQQQGAPMLQDCISARTCGVQETALHREALEEAKEELSLSFEEDAGSFNQERDGSSSSCSDKTTQVVEEGAEKLLSGFCSHGDGTSPPYSPISRAAGCLYRGPAAAAALRHSATPMNSASRYYATARAHSSRNSSSSDSHSSSSSSNESPSSSSKNPPPGGLSRPGTRNDPVNSSGSSSFNSRSSGGGKEVCDRLSSTPYHADFLCGRWKSLLSRFCPHQQLLGMESFCPLSRASAVFVRRSKQTTATTCVDAGRRQQQTPQGPQLVFPEQQQQQQQASGVRREPPTS